MAQASPMQVGMPVTSLPRTPMQDVTAEDALLVGATLPCSPQQEANLLNLNPLFALTNNHIKMMDILWHLDTVGLQFICESVEALHRERTPAQAPPGYRTPAGVGPSVGVNHSFPLVTSILQCHQQPGHSHHCAWTNPTATASRQESPTRPEIESAITNIQRHEQAS